MPHIYCLLVGINEYANPKNNLKGCLNDVKKIQAYLELSFDKDFLTIVPLVNEQATKGNIVEHFKLFQQAKNGDLCIFYFSGHGSTWNAPEFLHHLVPDKLLKSLVCHDSRVSGNIDLMDKEIAYLIWEATHQKDIQFIAITDSCHSGLVTKDDDDETYMTRELEKGTATFLPESFYGINKVATRDFLSPNFQLKRGRHIHIAACREDQKAIEGEIGDTNQRGGVFTYYLIEALQEHAGKITYKDLVDRIKIKIRQKVTSQSPQLSIVEDGDSQYNFLSTTFDTGNVLCQVYYDKTQAWSANVGILNSLLKEGDEANFQLKIIANDTLLSIAKIHASYTTLINADTLEVNKIYNAQLVPLASSKITIGLADIPLSLLDKLMAEYEATQLPCSFRFTSKIEEVIYLLKYQQDIGFYLTSKEEDISLFKRNKGFAWDKIADLFIALEKFFKWRNILTLENSRKPISEQEIKIGFYRITASNDSSDQAKKEQVKECDLVRLNHQLHENKWYPPGFQISIQNTSHRPLWISLLYLSDDYLITNRLLQKRLLQPNEMAWALDCNNAGDVFKTINVKLSDQLYQEGKNITQEYLKLLICTKEFDTNAFNQASVASNQDFKDLVDREKVIKTEEWGTRKISLEIYRP